MSHNNRHKRNTNIPSQADRQPVESTESCRNLVWHGGESLAEEETKRQGKGKKEDLAQKVRDYVATVVLAVLYSELTLSYIYLFIRSSPQQ